MPRARKLKPFLTSLTLTSLLLVSLSIRADDSCKPVNLYDDPKSPLHSMPIYNQGPLNICYAYTASQLIDYYLISHHKKDPASEPTNAHWIAFNHKTAKVFLRNTIQWKKKELGESYLRWAINDLRRRGNCKAEVVNRSMKLMKETYDLSDDEFLFLFERLWNRFRKNAERDWAAAEERVNLGHAESTDEAIDLLIKSFSEIEAQRARTQCAGSGNCEGASNDVNSPVRRNKLGNWLRSIKNIFKKVPQDKSDGGYLRYLKDSLFKECEIEGNKLDLDIPAPKGGGGGWASNRKISRKINQALDDKKDAQPVGIGYCSDIYNIPDTWKPMHKGGLRPRIAEIGSTKCNAHYSLLVGKKPSAEPGKCKYLIRNTLGDEKIWAKGWECECKYAKDEKSHACKWGENVDTAQGQRTVLGCWVEEDLLAPNTYDIEHF